MAKAATISCFMPRFYSNGYNLEICPRPSSRVSRLRPPAPCIWGMHAPLCSATCGRETAAGDSFCASRTRMSSAARRATARHSSRTCAGWGWTGTRDRMSEARAPLIFSPSAAPGIGSCSRAWSPQGRVYPCYCTPEELELSRKLQRMAGKPPRYAGTCRALSAAERAARAGARDSSRRCVSPCPEATVIEFTDLVHGPQQLLVGRHRRFHRSARGRHGRVLLLQRRRRFRHGRHPRVARRRSPHQHAAAVDAARRARHAAPRLRPRRPAGRRGRRAAVQAARQHQRAGVARARILAGGAPQSPVPSGAYGRRRRLAASPQQLPAHFRAEHLGRAPARFEESQLTALAEGDVAAHVDRRDRRVARPAGLRGVRRARAPQRGAARRMRSPGCPWCAANCRRSAPRSSASSPRPGAAFFAAAAAALDRSGSDLHRARRPAQARDRPRRRAAVHAAAGGAHRQDARTGARSASEAHAPGDGAPPARIPCSRYHNSLTGEKAEFKPLRGNEVRMYVCGITVYDYIHFGHARMLTVFDLVQRYLRSRGYAVTYVRNITDIDDKIIQRAAENGEDWSALARRFIAGHARGLRAARPATAGCGAARHRVHRRDRRDDADAHRQGLLPTGRRTATSCTRCASSRATARSREDASTNRARARACRSTSSSTIRSTSWCGSTPSRASPPGPRPGAPAVRAGTSNARRCRRRCSAIISTCTAGAWI